MRIVSTFEENKAINVKRYEQDLLVGERNVSTCDYAYSFMTQLPPGAIFQYLASNEADTKRYFESVNNKGEFANFMKMILSDAPNTWFKNDETILSLSKQIIKNLPEVSMDSPDVASFVQILIDRVKNIELNTDYYALFLELLQRILSTQDPAIKDKVATVVYSRILGLLQQESIVVVKDTIANIIPHIDSEWFSNMVIEAQRKSKKQIQYYSGKMPSKVDFVGVNSNRTTFVYDVPKQLVKTRFNGQDIGEIGYPRLIFMYTMDEKQHLVTSMRLYAAKEGDQLDNNMMLYEYPYSHVFSGGKVCWNYSDITLEMMPTAHELFLSANNSTHSRPNVFELFMEQKDCPYDDTKLKPIDILRNVL